jgi:hypothetical protein
MSETIAELVAKVLAEHFAVGMEIDPSTRRWVWCCACASTAEDHAAHVAEQVQRVVDARYAEVWDEGWGAAADEMHPSGPKTSRAPNPYRDAEEGA